ncbi:MAG: EF-hand domain-containing protein [Verrucomicrobiales bacterium]|nr:EF-hand domain-containing protein [Verrucomicrobiales bacterium]
MKTILTLIITALCLTFVSIKATAQSGKGDTLSGIVESVDGDQITVNHRRESKTFTIHDKTNIAYVSFLEADEEIKAGFFVRAGVDGKGRCNQLWVTLPIPEQNLKPSAEMLAMTPEELFQMADSNGDDELSYVEYATAIYRSPKHGPVGFNKSDRDKSGSLNQKEFATKLESIKWYRVSRKTPTEWHAEFDADSDGALSKEEFIAFLGSTAHIDAFLKRADKDKSGGISVEELAGFIVTMIDEE